MTVTRKDISNIVLTLSARKTKKYRADFYDEAGKRLKTLSFGYRGASDYLHHHDQKRRERYRKRHRGNIGNYFTPSFWSWYFTWGDSVNPLENAAAISREINIPVFVAEDLRKSINEDVMFGQALLELDQYGTNLPTYIEDIFPRDTGAVHM